MRRQGTTELWRDIQVLESDGTEVELGMGPTVTHDDTDKVDWDETMRAGWQGDPCMCLKWAILEDWVWDYLQGRAEIDVVAMRELVEFFPKLPVDLPERLLAMSSVERMRAAGPRLEMGNRRIRAKWHPGPGRNRGVRVE